ncbi:MAG: hypothetical protein HC923_07080 [Myxococcales bacterium]|nr:hypothetical protein [Myxococcales bacterium]
MAERRAPAPRPPWIEVDRLPIEQDIPSHAKAQSVLDAYFAELRQVNLQGGSVEACRLGPDQAAYVGTAVCAACHPEAHAFWVDTAHAKAWSTLEQDGKDADLTCVGCHSVGFRRPGGFCRLSHGESLRNVGCESCHGPGGLHVIAGDTSNIDRALASASAPTPVTSPSTATASTIRRTSVRSRGSVTPSGRRPLEPPAPRHRMHVAVRARARGVSIRGTCARSRRARGGRRSAD